MASDRQRAGAPAQPSSWPGRVRRITAAVAGAAGVGAIALTIGLAQAAHPASNASATPPTGPEEPAADPQPTTAAARPTASAPRTTGPAPATTPPGGSITVPPGTAADRAATPTTLAPPTRAPTIRPGRPPVQSGGS